ncbi:MAG TPA: MarR family transcriptional regulator [Longimicrobiales bacterium]|nr:MarR family transcriptional regulator [Longimicrobiales bacterium]
MTRIATAIKQKKPFSGPEHAVFLALQRLASELSQGVAELLKPSGLSAAQYNVLRILRGAGDAGLACGEIAGRLIARDPDMTRLLDRLERQGLVARGRSAEDRRVVMARITDQGLAVLADLDAPFAALHRRQLGHLGEEKLAALLQLLEEATPPSP